MPRGEQSGGGEGGDRKRSSGAGVEFSSQSPGGQVARRGRYTQLFSSWTDGRDGDGWKKLDGQAQRGPSYHNRVQRTGRGERRPLAARGPWVWGLVEGSVSHGCGEKAREVKTVMRCGANRVEGVKSTYYHSM